MWKDTEQDHINKFISPNQIAFYDNQFLDTSQISFIDFSETFDYYKVSSTV